MEIPCLERQSLYWDRVQGSALQLPCTGRKPVMKTTCPFHDINIYISAMIISWVLVYHFYLPWRYQYFIFLLQRVSQRTNFVVFRHSFSVLNWQLQPLGHNGRRVSINNWRFYSGSNRHNCYNIEIGKTRKWFASPIVIWRLRCWNLCWLCYETTCCGILFTECTMRHCPQSKQHAHVVLIISHFIS